MTISLVLIKLLFVSARQTVFSRDLCGSLHVQPCLREERYGTVEGFACATTDAGFCLQKSLWCDVGKDFLENRRCNASENLLFEHCLSVRKTVGEHEYLVMPVRVGWSIAEQYCQSQGYNLVSFTTQKEFDDLLLFLQSFYDNPQELLFRNDVTVRDPLAQRCWPTTFAGFTSTYWTGLYFDHFAATWNFTNGDPVNRNIGCGSSRLGDFLDTPQDHLTETRVSFTDRNFTFYRHTHSKSNNRIESTTNRENIICSRKVGSSGRDWTGLASADNAECITGFRCSSGERQCIIGSGFHKSEVCNGVNDCAEAEDESYQFCPYVTVRSGVKLYRFFPILRSVSEQKAFCRRKNFSLPTVQSAQDVQALLSLPKLFVQSRKSPDFYLSALPWKSLNVSFLLGVSGGSKTWKDGRDVAYMKNIIHQIPPNSDVFLRSYTDGSVKVVGIYEPTEVGFAVCQLEDDGLGLSLVVPIVVPVSSNPRVMSCVVMIVASVVLL